MFFDRGRPGFVGYASKKIENNVGEHRYPPAWERARTKPTASAPSGRTTFPTAETDIYESCIVIRPLFYC